MLRFLAASLFLLASAPAFCQSYADSLGRLQSMLDSALHAASRRPEIALLYADSAQTLILALQQPELLHKAYRLKGVAATGKSDKIQALHWYEMALENARKYDVHEGECLALVSLGGIYFQSGDYDRSLEYYRLFKSILGPPPYSPDLQAAQVTTRVFMGMLFKDQNKLVEAMQENKEGLELAIRYGIDSRIWDFYDNMGGIYGRMGNYKSKLEYHRKAYAAIDKNSSSIGVAINNLAVSFLLMNMLDSSAHYYQMAANHPNIRWRSLIHTYNGLSQVSFYRGRYEEALSWSEKSEPLTVKAGNPMTIVNTRRQMGKSLMGLKRYDEAIAIFEKLLVLMDANPQFAFIEDRSNIKKYLAQAVALKGGAPQVAAWIDDYSRGQDSIHNFVVAQAVEDLRIQYETQLVEDSLQLLQMENRLQTAKTTRYQISFFGGMALAISLGALLFYFLRQRRLEREIFQRQNELLLRENASLFDRIHAMERSSAPRSLQDFSNDAIVLNGNEKTVFRIGDIFFIQSQGNGVQVVTANDRHWRWQTMRNLSEALPCPPFIRVHRSFLINGMHIQKYSAQQLTLVNGDVIPVGITQAARVEDFLSKWLPDLV